MMRINSRQKESIQNLRVFTVFSVSSCNNTETHMSNYMVEVGPGGVTISMAVVAAAANRSKCMNLLFFFLGGGAHISI